MKCFFVVIVFEIIVVGAAALGCDRVNKGIDGTWEVVECVFDGKQESFPLGNTYEFQGDKVILTLASSKRSYTLGFELFVATKGYSQIAIFHTDGTVESGEKPFRYIYTTDGDTLRWIGGQTLPTDFKTTRGDGRRLLVMRRISMVK